LKHVLEVLGTEVGRNIGGYLAIKLRISFLFSAELLINFVQSARRIDGLRKEVAVPIILIHPSVLSLLI